ncbi:phosphatidylserine decarboxylase [Sporosarcina saromensis]|uniref:phosphatidylserine decarboxylase n=1 Tax=Sporosarcina saromensis TaxID=359365 RepID=A0ABU4G7J1_9BACL|nr:phosphatidylserine decarboxylase [Sporosarcina saromensis]MDW0112929.1 phosphatidylserine decarboxylase [Sporosarcina saromensis]
MKKTLFKQFVELTGHPVSSSILKTVTRSSMSKRLLKPFASAYRINEEEAEYPLEHYKSLQDFFTRNLKHGVRPIDQRANVMTSPVDGYLTASGKINEQQSFYIKDHLYSIKQILGDEKGANTYKDGFFYIFYLSPSHYHHFHYPFNGQLVNRYALGTTSFPVNDLGLRLGNQPFATNYRLISEMETSHSKLAIIKVGALNVNSIHLTSTSKNCTKGDEFGYFSFGSTVILFIEDDAHFKTLLSSGTEVKVGQPIGEWIEPQPSQNNEI